MPDKRSRCRIALAVAMLSLGTAACGHYEPHDRTALDDVPPGPGLFTGDDGAFYIVGEPDPKPGLRGEQGAGTQ